jgi:hypothetical protein
MIIGDDYIYLHLPKCGGNFVKNFIMNNDPSAKFTRREHMSIGEISSENYFNKKIYVTVRNPWDWYVSWYEYSRFHKTRWWNVFSDNTDGSFEEVIKNIFSIKDNKEFTERQYTTSHAWIEPIPVFKYMENLQCGWYTFRLLQIILENNIEIFEKKQNDLKEVVSDNLKIEFQKLEEINKSIENFAFNHLGIESVDRRIFKNKINKSNRTKYQDYYSDDTRELVSNGDKIFLELFNYSF